MVGKSTAAGQAPTFALVLERFEHNLLHLLDSIHKHTLTDDLSDEQKVCGAHCALVLRTGSESGAVRVPAGTAAALPRDPPQAW